MAWEDIPWVILIGSNLQGFCGTEEPLLCDFLVEAYLKLPDPIKKNVVAVTQKAGEIMIKTVISSIM